MPRTRPPFGSYHEAYHRAIYPRVIQAARAGRLVKGTGRSARIWIAAHPSEFRRLSRSFRMKQNPDSPSRSRGSGASAFAAVVLGGLLLLARSAPASDYAQGAIPQTGWWYDPFTQRITQGPRPSVQAIPISSAQAATLQRTAPQAQSGVNIVEPLVRTGIVTGGAALTRWVSQLLTPTTSTFPSPSPGLDPLNLPSGEIPPGTVIYPDGGTYIGGVEPDLILTDPTYALEPYVPMEGVTDAAYVAASGEFLF